MGIQRATETVALFLLYLYPNRFDKLSDQTTELINNTIVNI